MVCGGARSDRAGNRVRRVSEYSPTLGRGGAASKGFQRGELCLSRLRWLAGASERRVCPDGRARSLRARIHLRLLRAICPRAGLLWPFLRSLFSGIFDPFFFVISPQIGFVACRLRASFEAINSMG